MRKSKYRTYLQFLNVILLSTLFFGQPSVAQDTANNMMEAWKDLKSQLQRRADIFPNLTVTLSKSKQVDKDECRRANNVATRLYHFIDTLKVPDSSSLSFLHHSNNQLTQALARILVTAELDRELRNNNVVRELITHLQAVEHRLELSRSNYNHACINANRPELLFGIVPGSRAAEPKF